MALNVGDKCPQCKEGLLVRTEVGIACDECSFEQDITEVAAEAEKARIKAGEYVFKPKTFRITVDDPEEAEEFLRGCVLARQNNNSEYFQLLLDTLNSILQPWREAKMRDELRARDAGM